MTVADVDQPVFLPKTATDAELKMLLGLMLLLLATFVWLARGVPSRRAR